MKTDPPFIINLFAGPGTGKSRTAAGLFNLMKHRGYRVELVTEVAKMLTYERNLTALGDQYLLMCKQEYLQKIVSAEVDYIITDSPPLMGLAYVRDPEDRKMLFSLGMHFRLRYRNLDVLLKRDGRPYEKYGRSQSELEAYELDAVIRGVWESAIKTRPWTSFDNMATVADPAAIHEIFQRMVRDNDEWSQGEDVG